MVACAVLIMQPSFAAKEASYLAVLVSEGPPLLRAHRLRESDAEKKLLRRGAVPGWRNRTRPPVQLQGCENRTAQGVAHLWKYLLQLVVVFFKEADHVVEAPQLRPPLAAPPMVPLLLLQGRRLVLQVV